MALVVYRFLPLSEIHFPLLRRWLETPHVSRWWADAEEQMRDIGAHFADRGLEQFLIHADGRPIGYLQCYDLGAEPDHPFGLQPAGTRGIDQFIGEPDMIDRGHGSALIRAFVEGLFATGTPCVVTDPDPSNRRAIRAGEKAGFIAHGVIDTPWGRTLLMVRMP